MRVPHLTAKMTHDLPEAGQLVVYNTDGEKLIVLNDVGAAVYFLIDGQRSAEEIARFVQETLPGGEASAYERDVNTFLDQLTGHGIVSWTEVP